MYVIKFEELEITGHCVYEFCYSIRYPNNWNPDSVYVDYDDFILLGSYLEQVIPNYKYFAPQKVKQAEWKLIEALALEENDYQEFFQEIDKWKEKDPYKRDSFWIYGV